MTGQRSGRRPGTLRMSARALLRRCPNCGERHIWTGWFGLVERCPRCGLRFEREEGYWTGAMAIDTIDTEGLFGLLLLVVIVASWPHIPIVELLVAALALNLIFPIVFYPFAKLLWVAFDLIVRPRAHNEISGERW